MRRPFVYVNMAMTLDGKITSSAREYPKITSGKDRLEMDRLRAEADALLVGAQTLRADNPRLDVRDAGMREYRRKLGKGGMLRLVLTGSLDLSGANRFFEGSDDRKIVVTTEEADAGREAALAGRAEVWRMGSDGVDLPRVLDRLRAEGVERLLVEGGGEVNWMLLRDDLVDELHVTLAPALLGGRDAPTIVGGAGLAMADQRRLKLLGCRQEGDELYLHYAVAR